MVDAVGAVAKRLWPVKTARNLASRAGVTHRAGEMWLSGQTGMNAEALAELLRSDAGLAVLEMLIGERRPSWWSHFRDGARLGEIERKQAALAAELQEMRSAGTRDAARPVAR